MTRAPEDAIAWGTKQVDHRTKSWHNLCLQFVRLCFDVQVVIPDAGKSWDMSKTKHVVKSGREIPRGVPVHLELATEADHIMLSLGGGKALSNDFVRAGDIDVVDIDAIARKWGASRLGWCEDVNGVRVYNRTGAPTPAPVPPKETLVAPVTFIMDGSHWQFDNAPGFHLRLLVEQGYAAVYWKCTQGTNYVDPTYVTARRQAEQLGLDFAAYHFLERGNGDAQAAHLAKWIGDKSIPVVLDVEKGERPTWADVRAFLAGAKTRGLRVTLNYLPRSYWAEIGSPNLTGTPALLNAAYPTMNRGYGAALYPGHGHKHWAPYGGKTPTVWQFTSSGRLDGYAGNIDINAFKGTRADLRALRLFKQWGGTDVTPAPLPTPVQEDPVTPADFDKIRAIVAEEVEKRVGDVVPVPSNLAGVWKAENKTIGLKAAVSYLLSKTPAVEQPGK